VPNVSAAVRARVEQAITRLGYKPDPQAQGLRGGATRTVGIIVRDITIPALAGFVRAVQDTVLKAGYTLLITCSEDRPEREIELLSLMAERRVDGVIMTTCSEADPELAAAREALSLPLVMLDRKTKSAVDCVLIDHFEGMKRAIEYLAALGHRRIALITGGIGVYPGRERVRAFQEAIDNGVIDNVPQLIRARAFDSDSAFFETSAVVGMKTAPTAIIGGGIDMLPGILRSLRVRNMRVGEDISVIGTADSDLATLSVPAISVIRWSYPELGRTCARLLLEQIEADGKFEPREILYPTEFLIRQSCTAPQQR
jgi:LacI family transcriptional regulator